GVTHIRDMTCSKAQWECLEELFLEKKIKIYSEINFHIDNYQHLVSNILNLAIKAKEKSTDNPFVKVLGIKLFYDGSLGSETALLSKPYLGGETTGQQLWTNQECKEAIKLVWSHGLQISIHTLGDQAVTNIVEICRQLQREKINGILNLEHVQLIKPETIQNMKGLHVRCHMQPTHWLSDKFWLKEKLAPELYQQLFSWEALRKAKIPVFFGSDSPIEEVSLAKIIEALNDSAKNGIPSLQLKTLDLFSHPTKKNGETLISKGKVIKAELIN
ncbi:MAG: amidohydrolase family protein, partial [Bdellovibrionaceae bacterium]|nr:amidohydrolase family protein [Pseudobdellovibrionaceae bacterium]